MSSQESIDSFRRRARTWLADDLERGPVINPDIVYCHTRGFDRGPRSDSPGNDQTGCSLAGVTYEDGGCRDGGRPFWSLTSLGDTGNGFLSAIGVIQALYHRTRTGVTQSVDTSILNAGLLVASMASLDPDGEPLSRPHLDRMQLGLSPRYRLYQTTDGWLCVAAVRDAEWQAMLDALELDHGADTDAVESAMRDRTAHDAFALLDASGVPCEIADPEFSLGVFDDPEMRSRGLVVTQDHPVLGRFDHFGTTIDFSETPGRIWGPPPLVGQHTREIMLEYGFDDDDIDKLIETSAVFEERRVS